MTHWTEQDEATLTRLWNAGQSGSQIAKVLRVSRNAVIGKVHRLELPPRKTVARRIPVAHIRQPKKQRPPRRDKTVAPVLAQIAAASIPLRLSLLQLTDTSCRRPLGDPKDADFAFCGLPVREGSRYCPACHPLMYSTDLTKASRKKARKARRKNELRFDDLREAA